MHGQALEAIVSKCIINNWGLEFSSNIKYQPDLIKIYKSAGIKKITHNYFPAPEKPFVLNLASSNNEIREASINHCKQGIDLAQESTEKVFSFHAGFCIDPCYSELGRKIKYSSDYNKDLHFQHFIYSLNELLKYSSNSGIKLLIENNVISKENLLNQKNPLLCCSSTEIIKTIEQINNSNLMLLLDTAHLKVSCNTLNLNLKSEIEKLLPYIRAVHHSDNDGYIDNNKMFDLDYWVKNYMPHFKTIPHIIEVSNITDKDINNQIKLLKSWM
jgi:sugar phosphate isomerase/epimerase